MSKYDLFVQSFDRFIHCGNCAPSGWYEYLMHTFQLPRGQDQLRKDQIQQFEATGYLAFSDVLDAGQIAQCREALSRITAQLSGYADSIYSPPGAGQGNHSGASFKRPGSRSMIQFKPGFDPAGKPPAEVEAMVRKFMWFCDEDPVFGEMVSPGGRLHAVVESLLGASPILFQEMALVKPARVGTEKPWHQDNAYFSVEPLEEIVGVWLALDEATTENGCMHVIPGGHLEGGFKHHHGSDCEIAPELLETHRSVAVPIPAGGALFFYGMLPHETPSNCSPHRRRALQFHFRGAGTRIIDKEAYDRLFIDRSGRPASCRAASRLGF
jgi:phytanoyl-CoA hydroxylase